jgi:hypothetical protein
MIFSLYLFQAHLWEGGFEKALKHIEHVLGLQKNKRRSTALIFYSIGLF